MHLVFKVPSSMLSLSLLEDFYYPTHLLMTHLEVQTDMTCLSQVAFVTSRYIIKARENVNEDVYELIFSLCSHTACENVTKSDRRYSPNTHLSQKTYPTQ